MKLTTFRNKANQVVRVYKRRGITIFFYVTIGYLWKECIWFYIRIRTHSKPIKRVTCGNMMYLSRHDSGISKELAVFRIHEPISTWLLNQQIKVGMCVVDIGANIGYYALQEARLVGEVGKVIAIEPVPDNLTLLKKNVETNGFRNVKICPVAIGAKNESAKLYLSDESNLCSLNPQGDVHDSIINVPLRTLDSLLELEGKIDFIRMDTEGYETEIIKGMLSILNKYKPTMFIEIHQFIVGGKVMVRFLERLRELGYETKYVIDRGFDIPVVKGKNYVESISIDELIRDRRVVHSEGSLMIFLKAN